MYIYTNCEKGGGGGRYFHEHVLIYMFPIMINERIEFYTKSKNFHCWIYFLQ